jgi:hypothetical protein
VILQALQILHLNHTLVLTTDSKIILAFAGITINT